MAATLFLGTVGEGVWRSNDGGATWSRSSKGMFVECDVRALAVDPGRAGVVYAGTDEGVCRSDNHGDEWTRLDGPLDDLVTWALRLLPQSDLLLAGTRPADISSSTATAAPFAFGSITPMASPVSPSRISARPSTAAPTRRRL